MPPSPSDNAKVVLDFNTTSLLDPTYASWVGQLSSHERDALSQIGRLVKLGKGRLLYETGDPYERLFIILKGVVKTFRTTHDGHCTVMAFLFERDLAGLGEGGAYANSAEVVEDLTAFQLPVHDLEVLLRSEAHLEMLLLCKACNELRAAQQHAVLLSRHSARTKVALFLNLIAERQVFDAGRLQLPMGRTDIANYLGLSVEAVSRAFRLLQAEGVVTLAGPRQVTISDREMFARIVAQAD